MWERSQLKENAKIFLRKGYWLPFAVSLIIALISNGPQIYTNFNNIHRVFSEPSYERYYTVDDFNDWNDTEVFSDFNEFWSSVTEEYGSGFILAFAGIFMAIFLVTIVFSLTMKALLINPLLVGAKKFFLEGAKSGEQNLAISVTHSNPITSAK